MDSTQELTIRLRQQALIAELGLAALRGGALQALLEMAARLAASGTGAPFGKVLEYQPQEGAFLLRAGIGWREGSVGAARIGGGPESPAGLAFASGEPVISNDLAGERRFRAPPLMAAHAIRSAVSVVIRGAAGPFGVLEVDSQEVGAFTAPDATFLEALAHTLALAVDRDRRERELARLAALSADHAREAEEARATRDGLLREKELLLREVDHRVRNSLTVTRSLLSLQARLSPDGTREALEEATQRVSTIALVHDRLYRADRIGTVELGSYLRGLCGDLDRSTGLGDSGRALQVLADAPECLADHAITIGLVVTEVVSNAAKYGAGAVRVRCLRDPATGGLRLEVEDEGVGLPPGFDPAESDGLGMRLILALSQKLGGEPRWNGPAFRLDIPDPATLLD